MELLVLNMFYVIIALLAVYSANPAKECTMPKKFLLPYSCTWIFSEFLVITACDDFAFNILFLLQVLAEELRRDAVEGEAFEMSTHLCNVALQLEKIAMTLHILAGSYTLDRGSIWMDF